MDKTNKQRRIKRLPLILLFIFLIVMYFIRKNDESKIPVDHYGTEQLFNEDLAPFYHGVASGDPTLNKVIIWTKVTPEYHKVVNVQWELDTSIEFSDNPKTGSITTDSSSNYTVKVDVSGLDPNTIYYYRFKALGGMSPTGRTRTAPGGDLAVRLAVISCTNHEEGYFNVLGHLADRDDITAVVHLGDYIYEYGPGTYGDTTLKNRQHLPPHEIISLSDYRTRYAQYRLDPDFQRIHQMHPFISIWDDHEISNNAYVDGAQNHQYEEGDYVKRKSIAKQAYYEWLPVRGDTSGDLYRKIYLSSQAELFMLDERLAARSKQVKDSSDMKWNSADQQMLGKDQFNWLIGQLSGSQSRWKIIGNQVIFSPLSLRSLGESRSLNMDAWDGYPAERNRLIDFLHLGELENVVFITGDTHCSWAFEVPYDLNSYSNEGEGDVVALEFGTPSITSKNLDAYISTDSVQVVEKAYLDDPDNPHLKYVNMRDHGYLELFVDSLQAVASWYYTTDIKTREAGIFSPASFSVQQGTNNISRQDH